MKNYTINLKGGKAYDVISDKAINLQSLNNYSNFIEVDLSDGDKLIVAKDMIESVHIEEMETVKGTEDHMKTIFDKSDRDLLLEKFNITDVQLTKFNDDIKNYINNTTLYWDSNLGRVVCR